jgi:5-(carboxyamino)imidazole ribonucleotide synthase
MTPLAPGGTIGILGGGQLGRMLSLAAAQLGFDCHIYAPEKDNCAARVSAHATTAAYDDEPALKAFAARVDVITFEFENVPAATVRTLAASGKPVFPQAASLAVAQDRVDEKEFFNRLGIATAPFAQVTSRADLDAALDRIGVPAILKTRRLGYDGKGQARIETRADAPAALLAVGAHPAILEGFAKFAHEISIVAARSRNGDFVPFIAGENEHRDGILRVTRAPAKVDARILCRAEQHAKAVMEALNHVGVLAVEFFVMADGTLLANEFAPRVHNSGHWTQDGCVVSQFEQHIRAVTGWPLGPALPVLPVEMTNLIGADVERWPEFAADPRAHLYLYGKGQARPGRKMGHVNRLLALKWGKPDEN